jgi:hypothetical protein
MDQIKDLIIQIESLKIEQNFSEAIKMLEQALVKYN